MQGMYINNSVLLSVDAQAIVTHRELKLPHLNSYLINIKMRRKMIVATCEVASVIMVV